LFRNFSNSVDKFVESSDWWVARDVDWLEEHAGEARGAPEVGVGSLVGNTLGNASLIAKALALPIGRVKVLPSRRCRHAVCRGHAAAELLERVTRKPGAELAPLVKNPGIVAGSRSHKTLSKNFLKNIAYYPR